MPGDLRLTPGALDAITDVPGVRVGHHTRLEEATGWATGTTAVVLPAGAVASVDVRGGGPGTRETDLLDPANTVRHVHAVVLTGGSAFGLAAADGAMAELESRGIGLPMDAEGHVVPIVPAAVIFDLPVGRWRNRPDASFGAAAVCAALDGPAEPGEDRASAARGSIGAGAGARAGALRGGLGTASTVIAGGAADGHTVGAIVVANPVGSVFDPETGVLWGRGASVPGVGGVPGPGPEEIAALAALAPKGTVLNTTIGVVATDAALSKSACRRLAIAGQSGLTRAIRPAHSPLDGDTIFAVATGARPSVAADVDAPPRGFPLPADLAVVDALCAAAADCVERAIVDAILAAETHGDIPAYGRIVTGGR